MSDVLRLTSPEIEQEDRFSRFKLIRWWDQERLGRARVVVVGAGALGNEILKNLALLGAGRLFIVDLDKIEPSNLSRSVLFREDDSGRSKAEVAARSVKNIYPGARVRWLEGNVLTDVGLGVFLWADVVLAGLDNREARLFLNRSCHLAGRPWIDGAVEQLNGLARVFLPDDGPCYECTLSQADWDILKARRSCNFLTRDDMLLGRVPTTPTSAAVIAGLQCQEAVKYLHGLEVLAGKAFVFNGLTHESYIVGYERKPDCYSHEALGPWTGLGMKASETKLAGLLEIVRRDLGPEAVVEFHRDVVQGLECVPCGTFQPLFRQLRSVAEEEAVCPSCGLVRSPRLIHSLDGREDFLDMTVMEFGLPPFDIVRGRKGMEERAYVFDGDAQAVLGPVWDEGDLEGRQTP
ncbi:MAG: molybdopterin biosynthesis protein MoeB [Candidatus Aminicenantes bacterium RBG_13_63_10]|nr:MAG: molybdopterin biosynthesis protein MoeB [Candidatus Aminicenantes bacterium RBG_13_63_10]